MGDVLVEVGVKSIPVLVEVGVKPIPAGNTPDSVYGRDGNDPNPTLLTCTLPDSLWIYFL